MSCWKLKGLLFVVWGIEGRDILGLMWLNVEGELNVDVFVVIGWFV